ncbi:hypothetical protein NSY55_26725, partial [Pseudomonas aeruginosa]|nr:hypothetical protein [Pseudomonas aeruginosa]
ESMASGYWRDGALMALPYAQGWFATRDRGEWHNGRLTILGRIDNLFFSGGEGIQPESLERVIAAHPQINQVFIVPLDDAEFGQFPDWIQGRLARFEQPVHWLVLPAELKNGGIKISRQTLKQWVNAQLSA